MHSVFRSFIYLYILSITSIFNFSLFCIPWFNLFYFPFFISFILFPYFCSSVPPSFLHSFLSCALLSFLSSSHFFLSSPLWFLLSFLPLLILSFFMPLFFRSDQLGRRQLEDTHTHQLTAECFILWDIFPPKTNKRTYHNQKIKTSLTICRVLFEQTLNNCAATIQITFKTTSAWLNQKVHFRKSGSYQISFTMSSLSLCNSGWYFFPPPTCCNFSFHVNLHTVMFTKQSALRVQLLHASTHSHVAKWWLGLLKQYFFWGGIPKNSEVQVRIT